jgi:TolB-like protein
MSRILLVLAIAVPAIVSAAEPVSVAVMEFTSKGGVTQDQMDALSDMLAKEIEGLGNFRVIGKSDISSMLSLEEQKQRLNACDDQACLAEIGGALGVRWVVVGNVSLFGDTYLLNMKLIDVEQARVAGRVSKSITGGESKLIAGLPTGAAELFKAVAGQLGVKAPKEVPGKEPVKDVPAGTPDGKPAGTVSAEAPGEWFSKSVERKGRFFVSAYTGGGMFPETSITSGDELEQDLDGALWALDSERQVFKVGASGGYYLFNWLSIGPRVAYLKGSGEGYYQDYDCSTPPCWADDLRRTRWAIELGVDVRAAWQFDFWIEPVASVTMGFNWMFDDTPQSYWPDALDSGTIELGCSGFFIDAGLGADLYLYSHWRVGAMFYYAFRSYGVIEGDGYRMQGSRMFAHGGYLVFNTGWIF